MKLTELYNRIDDMLPHGVSTFDIEVSIEGSFLVVWWVATGKEEIKEEIGKIFV